MKKHSLSHMDHGFTTEQWTYIFAKYADKTAFFIDTFELPEHLGTVTNELYGPSVGDPPVAEADVFYGKRGDRAWTSRLTMLPKRSTRFVRVIAGPHEETCTQCQGNKTVLPEGGPVVSYVLEQITCPTCNGLGQLKYECILYTAYGVHALDAVASPKEVGDLWEQLKACKPSGYVIPGMEARYEKLLVDFDVADAFWRQHALSAPLDHRPCPDCGAPRMAGAYYDNYPGEDPRRCNTCGTL